MHVHVHVHVQHAACGAFFDAFVHAHFKVVKRARRACKKSFTKGAPVKLYFTSNTAYGFKH